MLYIIEIYRECNIQKRDVGEEITAQFADLDIPCSDGGLVSDEMPRWRVKPRPGVSLCPEHGCLQPSPLQWTKP
jgi:hypothetical protein